MKKDWTYKKLGEVAKTFRGLTYSKADEVVTSSKKVLRSNNIDLETHQLNFDEIKYLREDFVVPEDKKIKKDSIFICMSNGSMQHLGKVAYVDKDYDYAFGGFMGLIMPTPNVCSKYVYYSLLSPNFLAEILKNGKGANINNLRFTDIEQYSLPIPPLSDQELIVRELDAIHGILDKKQEQLRELDHLAQAIFYDMFGDPITNPKQWEVKKLGEVCDVRDGTHDSPKYLPSSEYILITSKNIVNGEIDFSVSNYINREDFEAINRRSRVDVGDIIMPMIGTIGNPIIIKPTEKKFCIKNVALIKFANAEEVINVYIRELLDSPSYIGFLKSINQGGTQKFIALGTIRKLSIPLPPLSLQQSFAAKIEAIEAQKTAIRQSIREVEALLAERMDAYFA